MKRKIKETRKKKNRKRKKKEKEKKREKPTTGGSLGKPPALG